MPATAKIAPVAANAHALPSASQSKARVGTSWPDERHDRPSGQLESTCLVQHDGGTSVGEVVVTRYGDGTGSDADDRRKADGQDDQAKDDPSVAAAHGGG